MSLSNSEQEMLWVDAWSELLELVAKEPGLRLVDADWHEITIAEAQGEIQSRAYRSMRVRFERQWYRGQPALQLTFAAV